MVPEFIKKSSKIIGSNRCMPIIPTSGYKNYKGAYGKKLEIRI